MPITDDCTSHLLSDCLYYLETSRGDPMTSQRAQVIQLYKTLLHLGRDYPQGYDFFQTRLKKSFMKNRNVQDPEKISTMIKHGEYIVKELEALYMLRKYRTIKRRYYNEPLLQDIKLKALENIS